MQDGPFSRCQAATSDSLLDVDLISKRYDEENWSMESNKLNVPHLSLARLVNL